MSYRLDYLDTVLPCSIVFCLPVLQMDEIQIVRSSLGRNASIGDAYDIRVDTLVPETFSSVRRLNRCW